jgi:predicted MPP superfamily phosphohydrolase
MSAFQAILPRELLWGSYEERGSRLYTTSGFGHWFPFRLGCPTEAPLIVLERGRPT